jgi:hypothetical protein
MLGVLCWARGARPSNKINPLEGGAPRRRYRDAVFVQPLYSENKELFTFY